MRGVTWGRPLPKACRVYAERSDGGGTDRRVREAEARVLDETGRVVVTIGAISMKAMAKKDRPFQDGDDEEAKQILHRLAAGQLTAEDADRML